MHFRLILLTLTAIMLLTNSASATIGLAQEQIFTVRGLTGDISYLDFEDLDGDGFPEVLATDDTSVVLYSVTGDSIIFSAPVPKAGISTKVLLADVTRDSIADIAVGQWAYESVFYDTVYPYGDSSAFLTVYDGVSDYTQYPSDVFTMMITGTGYPQPPVGMLKMIDSNNDGLDELFFSYHTTLYHLYLMEFTAGINAVFDPYPVSANLTNDRYLTNIHPFEWPTGQPGCLSTDYEYTYLEHGSHSHNHRTNVSYMHDAGTFVALDFNELDFECDYTDFRGGYRQKTEIVCIGNLDTTDARTQVLSRNVGSSTCASAEEVYRSQNLLDLFHLTDPLTVELAWSLGIASDNLSNFIYLEDFPGYFFAFHDGAFTQFSGADGSVNQSTTLIPTGDMHWDYPYDDDRARLIVVNGNEVEFYQPDIVTDVEVEPSSLPIGYRLGQNYPNPFNPSTVIEYSIPDRAHVNITVFNVLGQKVVTLVNRDQSAGIHTVTWDGRDSQGQMSASGVYLYRITAGDYVQSRRMVLLK